MDNIKIIRLQSGEDIIASFEQEQYSILVKDPMTIIFKRLTTGKVMMLMMPWIPMEIVSHNIASIDNQNVLTIFEPKDSLVVYYNKSIENLYNRKAEEDSGISESLLSDDYNPESEESFDNPEDDSEESYEDMLDSVNNYVNKRTLH